MTCTTLTIAKNKIKLKKQSQASILLYHHIAYLANSDGFNMLSGP